MRSELFLSHKNKFEEAFSRYPKLKLIYNQGKLCKCRDTRFEFSKIHSYMNTNVIYNGQRLFARFYELMAFETKPSNLHRSAFICQVL